MRINLFSNGDCTDVNVWSGVPYYFYRHLLANSIDVRPFDLNPSNGALYPIFNRMAAMHQRALQLIHPVNPSDSMRSRSSRMLNNRRLRTMVQQHGDVDLNLFLTFTFSSYAYAPIPVVHYCDRTYEHHLEDIGRSPTWNDRAFIQIDRQNIENAALVLTMSDVSADFIKSRYKARRVFCLKMGARTDVEVPDPHRLIAGKEDSTNILFVGRGVHKRGVDILIRAFRIFNARNGGAFTLHVVGVQPNELPEALRAVDPKIRFYPFLDKTVPAELQQYNNLLSSAKLFVIPMRPGPVPGVIKEVQLLCTPVIASSVSGVSEYLTHEHDSLLVDSLEPQAFAQAMEGLIHDTPRWRRLALNGHLGRRNYTWPNTVKRFLEILRECNLVKTEDAAYATAMRQ
jgi:glycosyltransferase involved in cell wall biosynthesis